MAIVKTVFDVSSQALNAADVFAFLNANKSGWFDSVTQDTSGNITCTVDGVDCLKLGFDGSKRNITITTANNTTGTDNNTNYRWEYGYVTSKGIMLYSKRQAANVVNRDISLFITKNDSGDIAIVSIWDGYNSNQAVFVVADIFNGDVTQIYNGTVLTANDPFPISPSGVTTFTPIALTNNNISYTPDLFFTLFSQYCYIPSVLTIGGTQYVYDGRIALRE